MRRIMPWRTGHAASRVRARAAHVEPGDGRTIITIPQHRPRRIELIERHMSVENVAADQPERLAEARRRLREAADPLTSSGP